jgi:hypothetical protein
MLALSSRSARDLEPLEDFVRWAKQPKGAWLLGLGYVSWLVVFVVAPAPGGDMVPRYYWVTALVIAHLALWLLAGSAAQVWIPSPHGFADLPPNSWLRKHGGVAWLALLLSFMGLIALIGHWRRTGPPAAWDALVASPWVQVPLRATLAWGEGFARVFSGTDWLVYVAAAILWGISSLRTRELAATTRALEADAARQQLARHAAESDLRLLQAQLEPHFIYNTLANLRYLVQRGSPDALRMTDALIEYLRTAVPDIRALRVPLGREVDHAHYYLELMRMRMPDRLRFSVDVPDPLRAVDVPPLTVLTLVENAVKHGIAPAVDGGEIVLRAVDHGDRIDIEVADTGVGIGGAPRSSPQPSTGVGLDNLRHRLRLSYGREIALKLEANTPRGTRARLALPHAMPPIEAAAAVAVSVAQPEAAR